MQNPVTFVDSHTEGEPTRVIIEGGPDLGNGSLRERRDLFAASFDSFRRMCILEPHGSDDLVGALLCKPVDPGCAAGVIFFNNEGVLGMCGHGTIGLAVTLAHLGRIGTGQHRIETPVGLVGVELISPTEASIENVASYRYRKGVAVERPDRDPIRGDVAWGGNWFFLAEQGPIALELHRVEELLVEARIVKEALRKAGITGKDGAEIDHIEFFGRPGLPGANSRNFVYCPGGAYDRSPCGTGVSAKLACLAEDGRLQEGEIWIQESIIGSHFEASYRRDGDGRIIPKIKGRAYICSEGRLIFHPDDPFRNGIAKHP
ncbi:proline racemase family protein [Pontiella sp.]|uniref:proline racemase family protein n=1 Tax=Pontiella sp. TaxID=2837462 RepID=UPI0035647754